MPKTNARLGWVLMCLSLSALACNTVTDFIRLEGPEDLATDAFNFITPAPGTTVAPVTAGPGEPTRTPVAPATPAAELELTLDEADDAEAALRPAFEGDLALDSLADATRYVLDVTVSFESEVEATIAGTVDIRYTNQTGSALDELYLMLWPNHPSQYLGSAELGTVMVDGAVVEPDFEHGGLAARLTLAEPLAPGAAAEISADFTAYAVGGLEGGARYGLSHGVLLAPTFYPMIPRFFDGEWETEPAPRGGDTTNSETSFYAWRITAPADMAVAATGTVIESSATGNSQTQVLVTGPVRDLALVVGPLEATQRTVDGVILTAYVLPRNAGEADRLLDQAARQLENLQALVGPYPYTELDIIDAPGAFGGIEYPALIFIGVVDGGGYEVANVHEVGHQWFYGLIGDDQLREPWLDEAAASYTEVLYYEATRGPAAAERYLENFWGYVDASQYPDLPIGLPIDEYPGGEYVLMVYGKGALFFDALRRELGDETFFEFLRSYYDTYRYGTATSEGFQAVAEQTCACELDELFNLWVYEGGPVERP